MSQFIQQLVETQVAVPPKYLNSVKKYIIEEFDKLLTKAFIENSILLAYHLTNISKVGKVSPYQSEVIVDVSLLVTLMVPVKEQKVLAEVKTVAHNTKLTINGLFEGEIDNKDYQVGQLIRCIATGTKFIGYKQVKYQCISGDECGVVAQCIEDIM